METECTSAPTNGTRGVEEQRSAHEKAYGRKRPAGYVEISSRITTATKTGQKHSRSFRKHLFVRSSVFQNEISEKQVPNPIGRQQSRVGNTANGLQRVP